MIKRIYQITERDPEHDYRFMGLDYVQKKGITVTRADYDLIYTAPLTEKDTLDGIYERFNIQRPADFTGHSLSVSDVVVLNDGSTVKAYYVDSIGFAELPEFFKERNVDGRKTHFIPNGVNRPQILEASLITDKFGLKKGSCQCHEPSCLMPVCTKNSPYPCGNGEHKSYIIFSVYLTECTSQLNRWFSGGLRLAQTQPYIIPV